MPIIDWFEQSEGEQDMSANRATQTYEQRLEEAGDEAESQFVCAAAEVIADQVECGINIYPLMVKCDAKIIFTITAAISMASTLTI